MNRNQPQEALVVFFTSMSCLWGLSSPASADTEAVAHAVAAYRGAGQCCSSCSDLDFPPSDAAWVLAALDDQNYDQLEYWVNDTVDGVDFKDGQGDETDPFGTDFADVVFYSGHGSHHCDSSGYYSSLVMGRSKYGYCRPNTEYDMRFGDSGGDANIAIFAACQSAQFCVWDALGYNNLLNGSANILNGFHGDSYDDIGNTLAYDAYVSTSETNGLGDNWLDELEADPIAGDDQCPTSIVYGSSAANRDSQFNNGGFQDFHDTGSHTGTTIYYECGCNPGNGEALPSC